MGAYVRQAVGCTLVVALTVTLVQLVIGVPFVLWRAALGWAAVAAVFAVVGYYRYRAARS